MITTPRLQIRQVRPKDADALHACRVAALAIVGNPPRSLEETRQMVAEMAAEVPGAQPGWAQFIIHTRDGAHAGDIGVNFGGPGQEQAEIGYTLCPEARGRGYGREAVAAMVGHLFEAHRLHRLVAITGLANVRSRRLLEAVGFRQEGVTLESYWHHADRRFIDEAVYGLLAREWRALQAAAPATAAETAAR
jgi:RimJ/RimL family protein N-acetyltransferase